MLLISRKLPYQQAWTTHPRISQPPMKIGINYEEISFRYQPCSERVPAENVNWMELKTEQLS